MKQKEQINITIKDLDDLNGVLKSIELLFTKLILYYGDTDLKKLNMLLISCANWFGKLLRMSGYSEEDFEDK